MLRAHEGVRGSSPPRAGRNRSPLGLRRCGRTRHRVDAASRRIAGVRRAAGGRRIPRHRADDRQPDHRGTRRQHLGDRPRGWHRQRRRPDHARGRRDEVQSRRRRLPRRNHRAGRQPVGHRDQHGGAIRTRIDRRDADHDRSDRQPAPHHCRARRQPVDGQQQQRDQDSARRPQHVHDVRDPNHAGPPGDLRRRRDAVGDGRNRGHQLHDRRDPRRGLSLQRRRRAPGHCRRAGAPGRLRQSHHFPADDRSHHSAGTAGADEPGQRGRRVRNGLRQRRRVLVRPIQRKRFRAAHARWRLHDTGGNPRRPQPRAAADHQGPGRHAVGDSRRPRRRH